MAAVRAEIDEYPLDLAASVLSIAPSTLRVWARKIRKAKLPNFDHKAGERIITAQSMAVYFQYKSLLDRGYSLDKAANQLRIYGV